MPNIRVSGDISPLVIFYRSIHTPTLVKSIFFGKVLNSSTWLLIRTVTKHELPTSGLSEDILCTWYLHFSRSTKGPAVGFPGATTVLSGVLLVIVKACASPSLQVMCKLQQHFFQDFFSSGWTHAPSQGMITQFTEILLCCSGHILKTEMMRVWNFTGPYFLVVLA